MKIKKLMSSAFNWNAFESGRFGWQCYGDNARYIDFNDDKQVSCVFDSQTGTVFEISCSSLGNKHFRWVKKSMKKRYNKESKRRGFDPMVVYDDVRFTMLSRKRIIKKVKQISESSR